VVDAFGVVVVVVVVAVVDGVVAVDDVVPDAPVVAVVDGVVDGVVDEEVVDPEAAVVEAAVARCVAEPATATPIPRAPTVAVRPRATVARRMRTSASSLDRTASFGGRGMGGRSMAAPLVRDPATAAGSGRWVIPPRRSQSGLRPA
jgi:hypothetical protein